MSRNLEIVRSAYEAFKREDYESALASFDPDVEYYDEAEALEAAEPTRET